MSRYFVAALAQLLQFQAVWRLGFVFFGVIVNLVALGAFKMNYRSGCFFLCHLFLSVRATFGI